jgi:DNA mismatch endonuclease (patch repair protein)
VTVWRYPPRREYRPRDPAMTSKMMSAVKSKGSRAELMLRAELWRRGYRYRLHYRRLVGKPDMVFPRHRVAVFVDSDFWHARALVAEGEPALRATIRGERQDWWVAKLTRNAARDVEVTEQLTQDGWTVVRVWESEVLDDSASCADRVESVLRKLDRQHRKFGRPSTGRKRRK